MIALPVNVKLFITFVVTQGLKSVFNLFNSDISGKNSAFVAVTVGAVIFYFEGLLALVPPDKVEIVSTGLTFAGMILGTFGIHHTYKGINS